MGNLISPPQDTLVLVPPRISTRGLTRPIEVENPMSIYFGNLFRREVLQDLHSFRGSFGLDFLMAPEHPPTAAAHVSMTGSVLEKTVDGGSLNLHVNNQLSPAIHALGRLTLGTGSGITGYAMLSHDVERGRVSLTCASDGQGIQRVGFRGQSSAFLFGTETPVADPRQVSTWMISRIGKDVTVGVSGSPLLPEAPVEISASLDRRVPGTDSTYCLSSTLRSPSNELTVGFSQHLVTHRKVYNPFEDKRVKFIANYVDIAVEATSGGAKNSTAVAAGVSWQPNKNVIAKAHISTHQGLVGTLAVRNWWVPSVLTCVSAGIDAKGTPFLGGRFQLSNWLTRVEYERGQPISQLPSTKWMSIEDVSRFSPSQHYGVD